jgi:hypothetical protein
MPWIAVGRVGVVDVANRTYRSLVLLLVFNYSCVYYLIPFFDS